MNRETAYKMRMGDYVIQPSKGEPQRINSIQTRGMAAPYFRLEGDNGDLTSFLICRPHSRDGMQWSDRLGWVSIPEREDKGQ
jgi:hypothetical protein